MTGKSVDINILPTQTQISGNSTYVILLGFSATAKQYRRSVETAKLEARDRADEVLSFIEAEKTRPVFVVFDN
jgi:hypothetical protein